MNSLNNNTPLNPAMRKPPDPHELINQFMTNLDSYSPTLPLAVVEYYLSKSGVKVCDPRITKFVALAADKFLADIVYESKQTSLLRSQAKPKGKRKIGEANDTFNMEDLSHTLHSRRISVCPHKHAETEN